MKGTWSARSKGPYFTFRFWYRYSKWDFRWRNQSHFTLFDSLSLVGRWMNEGGRICDAGRTFSHPTTRNFHERLAQPRGMSEDEGCRRWIPTPSFTVAFPIVVLWMWCANKDSRSRMGKKVGWNESGEPQIHYVGGAAYDDVKCNRISCDWGSSGECFEAD